MWCRAFEEPQGRLASVIEQLSTPLAMLPHLHKLLDAPADTIQKQLASVLLPLLLGHSGLAQTLTVQASEPAAVAGACACQPGRSCSQDCHQSAAKEHAEVSTASHRRTSTSKRARRCADRVMAPPGMQDTHEGQSCEAGALQMPGCDAAVLEQQLMFALAVDQKQAELHELLSQGQTACKALIVWSRTHAGGSYALPLHR